MVFSNGVKFDLDVSGIAGFFGGDESIAAMASVNLIRYRWLLGWYNSPGSYFVSKKYGIIAGTRIWDGLFPGRNSIPATILGLDGKHGPKFMGAKSGTSIPMTGHLSHLLFSHCIELEAKSSDPSPTTTSVTRTSSPSSGTSSNDPPENDCQYTLTLIPTLDNDDEKFAQNDARRISMDEFIKPMEATGFFAAFLTIGLNVAAAVVAAARWHDFFCCIAISVGILCNGFATLVYGSATLQVHMPFISKSAVVGDGILVLDNDVVILQGPESKIASIARGRYELKYPGGPPYHRIGYVSMALAVQAFSQLILLPVATLKGQILFLATFVISWLFNAYMASVDRESLQFQALKQLVGLGQTKSFEKQVFLRWSSMAAASAFYLRPIQPKAWIQELIPNDTPVWNKWREYMVQAIEDESLHGIHPTFDLPKGIEGWDQDNKNRLMEHLEGAKIGYEWYRSQQIPDEQNMDSKYE